jgi:uncharacterized membrane protein
MLSSNNFVDYISLVLWLVFACLMLLYSYGRRLAQGIPLDKLRVHGVSLASVSVPLTIFGLAMTLTWPLTGAANIVISEPVCYFGFLLTAFSWRMARGTDLDELRVFTVPTVIGGIFLLVLSVAIVANGVGSPPASEPVIGKFPFVFSILWALAYACTGLAAITSQFYQILPWRRLFLFFLVASIIMFGIHSVLSTLSHVQMFHDWVPSTLR